ncbi:hypothetical protein JMN32_24915 [Fulvivirga sp. 29W222]|uniref:Uncharacterized protein n=1 Tax=Fulvivirga marina TaxID=2494733 RepID=A0A937G6Z8_9BACT|nr:hypothetical protein [Fulvivirga marina]MBL6449576.1 hypothetical protein [Fulvivirga marina]
MAKKLKTILKNTAIKVAKEAEHRSINTNLHEKDTVQYSQFPWWVAPNNSFFQKLIGVSFNWLGLLMPVLNIYFFNNLFNLLFRTVKINTLQNSKREVRTRPDRRYKTGRRIVGERTVTYYFKNPVTPYIPLDGKEIIHNRIWAAVLLILLGGAIYQSFNDPAMIDLISSVIIGAFIGLLWSMIRSHLINKKVCRIRS